MMRGMVSDPDFVVIESFEAFYRRAWHEIHRAVALGVGNADLAGEAVDEAMVRAYERWGEVSGFENREGWVYRVAMNWARSWLRRLRYRSVFDVPDVGVDDPDVVDPKVLEAIGRLSFRHREIVIARFVLDLSEAEMSEVLGVPKGTVKSRLHRALAVLKEDLS